MSVEGGGLCANNCGNVALPGGDLCAPCQRDQEHETVEGYRVESVRDVLAGEVAIARLEQGRKQ